MKHLCLTNGDFKRNIIITLMLVLLSKCLFSQELCPNEDAIKIYNGTMTNIMSNDYLSNKMRLLTEAQDEYTQVREQYDECKSKNSDLFTNIGNLGIACNAIAVRVNNLIDKHAYIKSDIEFRLNSLNSFKESIKIKWPKCGTLF